MIDLHTHSIHSDGDLIPAELVQRAKHCGYKAMAITDHADESGLEQVVSALRRFVLSLPPDPEITVLAGVELTHLYPEQIARLVKKARKLGAEIVVVHGETLVEPVPAGTNLAAIQAGADIIAHPGLLTPEACALAAKKGVFLEITTRAGHSLANGWVAKLAARHGASLVLNTDSHSPSDLTSWDEAKKIAQGAGLSGPEIDQLLKNSRGLVLDKLSERKVR
jgi:histidinol phosphatase-like PHP family hydrolase